MTDATEPKALRLARYLREYVGLRSTTVRDVGKYETVLWFGEMPQDPDCRSPAWSDNCELRDPWLEVHKQTYPKQPAPPTEIVPWIDGQALERATGEMPELSPVIHVRAPDAAAEDDEEPSLVERLLQDHPDISRAYETYRPKWQAWSEHHRRCGRIQRVYADLFRLRTQLQKQGELFELVLGLGLLNWRTPVNGKALPVFRHAVTIPVELQFDAATGVIRVEAAAAATSLKIEDDMLEADLRPVPEQYAALNGQLEAIGCDIWDRPSLEGALKSWATILHADLEWSPELRPSSGSDGKPLMSFAPALILRKRTRAGMVRIYDAIIGRLSAETEDVPAGWGGLIEDEDDRDAPSSHPAGLNGAAPANPASEEIYFPLPANREQRQIVEAISDHRGVLVQGPPGTGKSHTIANLVCHLLATGKRVLITAETAHALRVLKDKLPEEIQPLCVSLLGQGGDAFAELNAAVQGITTRQDAWNQDTANARIAEIERELKAKRRRLAEIDTELRSLRHDETCPHSLSNGAFAGSASAIAAQVAAERNVSGWLCLPPEAKQLASLGSEEMTGWLHILRRYDSNDIAGAARQTIHASKLLSPQAFSAAVMAESRGRRSFEAAAEYRKHPAYRAIAVRTHDERGKIAENFQALMLTHAALVRQNYKWLPQVFSACLAGRQAQWTTLHEASLKHVEEIEALRDAVGSTVVSLPAGKDIRRICADVIAVIQHLESGGKWTAFGLLVPKAVKDRQYLRSEVNVDGVPAGTVEVLKAVLNHLDMKLALGELEQAWAILGGLPSSPSLPLRISGIKEHIRALADVLSFAERCQASARALGAAKPPIPEPNWLDGQLRQWLGFIELADFEDKLRQTTAQVTSNLSELEAIRQLHDAHPIVAELVRLIERRDVAAYSQAYEQLKEIEQTRQDQARRQNVEMLLDACVPGLAASVRDTLGSYDWNERFENWERAWNWAIADNWLRKRADVGYQQKQWDLRRDTEQAIGELLAEAAALHAWTHFFKRLHARERNALRSWRAAVQAMGRGTGRSARMERLRREARQYMEQCRDAIPVWVMPRYLVAEMLDPTPGRYDLVIVDEASQLGIESLFLFYVSKKIVVGGDDQQISPYGIGIGDAEIANLQRHHLNGIPHQHALSAQSSLYANAKIRFSRNIVLREHFRCMPEIIQFSNDLCYASNGTPLDPLRSYPANRLKPLVVRHVPDGYRKGSTQNAVNEPEADALLGQIIACINDRRYDGLSIGVISLQGDTQAKLIEHKLLERLEPEVIEARRLICGDAYAFQGDERDIIFLSMVAAPGETRIVALSSDSARQRFNVAASRARNQLWLFHSATLDVLSPLCVRHRLLKYMLDPRRNATPDPNQLVFESQFERDVFDIIVRRHFAVRTQVCVGANHRYRIDLVVEGMRGRIAVECDGDQWHGPDRYEYDMARQRDLERAGWQFVRIRGSDFYRDHDRAMQPLWDELDRYGIKPGGIDEGASEPPPPIDLQALRFDLDEADEALGAPEAEGEGDAVLDIQDSNRVTPEEGEDKETVNALESAETPFMRKHMMEYVAFDSPCADPRTVSLGEIADALCDIIEVEGPVLVRRAYGIYLRGSGVKRLGAELKRTLNKALTSAIRQGRVISEKDSNVGGLIYSTVRLSGTPAIKLRRRGPRVLEEIPPGELCEAAVLLSSNMNFEYGSNEHLRSLLDCFELKRLTAQTSAVLQRALKRQPVQEAATLFDQQQVTDRVAAA